MRLSVLICFAGLIGPLAACTRLRPSPEPQGRVPSSTTVLPLAQLPIMAKIEVGGYADWMGVGFGSLWIPVPGKLLRVDPVTSRIRAEILIGSGSYRGVGIGPNAVWILSCGERKLFRVDPATDRVTAILAVPVDGNSEGSIGVDESAVWVVTRDGPDSSAQLTRLAPDGNVVAKIPIPNGSSGVVAAYGSVWVTDTTGNALLRIDPAANKVLGVVPVDSGPRFLAAGEGSIWVLGQGEGIVDRIDPRDGSLIARIPASVPGSGGDIAVGEAAVWVSTNGAPVVEIDPRENRVVRRFEGGSGADAIRAGLGFIWVTEHAGRVWQIPASELPR